MKVGRAVPSSPGEVERTLTLRVPSDARGARGTVRPTTNRFGQHALKDALLRRRGTGQMRACSSGERKPACWVALDLLCLCATEKAFGYDIGTGNSVD